MLIKERLYFITLLLAATVGWGAFGLIVFQVDPYRAAWYELLFFYFSLALSLTISFFFIGWGFRVIAIRNFRLREHLGVLWRQSFMLSFLALLLLLLQSVRLLFWWNIVALALAVLFFELFFHMYKKDNH